MTEPPDRMPAPQAAVACGPPAPIGVARLNAHDKGLHFGALWAVTLPVAVVLGAIAATWPWAQAIGTAWQRITALPQAA